MSGALWAKRDERGISRESLVSHFAGNPAFASLGTQAPVMQATGDQRTIALALYGVFSVMIAIVASRSLTLSVYFIRFTYVLFLSVCTFYLYAFYLCSFSWYTFPPCTFYCISTPGREGAGGGLSYKGTRIFFYERYPNSFPSLRGTNSTTTIYIKVPTQLWQQSF